MALLLATYWQNLWQQMPRRILATATIVPILALVAAISLSQGIIGKPSQKHLIKAARAARQDQTGDILYWQHRPFSARYYSEGKALLLKNQSSLEAYLNNQQQDYLIATDDEFSTLPEKTRKQFRQLQHYRDWILWQEIR